MVKLDFFFENGEWRNWIFFDLSNIVSYFILRRGASQTVHFEGTHEYSVVLHSLQGDSQTRCIYETLWCTWLVPWQTMFLKSRSHNHPPGCLFFVLFSMFSSSPSSFFFICISTTSFTWSTMLTFNDKTVTGLRMS